MTNEKVEILCSVLHVGPEKVSRHNDFTHENWYYVEGKLHQVSTQDFEHPDYKLIAQIGPYKVYGPK